MLATTLTFFVNRSLMQFVVIIEQNVRSRSLEIVELFTFDSPVKRPQSDREKDDGERDEGVDGVHEIRFSLNALVITNKLDADMPIAASQGGTQPLIAKGTAIAL